jgi:hypothetical protein
VCRGQIIGAALGPLQSAFDVRFYQSCQIGKTISFPRLGESPLAEDGIASDRAR